MAAPTTSRSYRYDKTAFFKLGGASRDMSVLFRAAPAALSPNFVTRRWSSNSRPF
jgi:hypothetical protein